MKKHNFGVKYIPKKHKGKPSNLLTKKLTLLKQKQNKQKQIQKKQKQTLKEINKNIKIYNELLNKYKKEENTIENLLSNIQISQRQYKKPGVKVRKEKKIREQRKMNDLTSLFSKLSHR